MKRIHASVYHRSTRLATVLAYGTAAVLVVMLALQLFSYESLGNALLVLLPTGFIRSVPVITALLVIIELFALPYFLPIALSPLARYCALACAWLVPLLWIGLMMVGLDPALTATVPLFGTKLGLDMGVVPVCLMLVMLSCVATISSLDYRQHKS